MKQESKDKDLDYAEETQKAIEEAIIAGAGKPPEDVRFLIRRSYPFGPLRKGRPYKIWNKLVLAKEAELGLEHRLHKKTIEKMKSTPKTETAKPAQSESCVMRLGGCFSKEHQ